MEALTLLRRLAEHHDYSALREASVAIADFSAPGAQVLVALADAHLGDTGAARGLLASLDRDVLDVDARVDLAAVHMALGELDEAVAILEAARSEVGLAGAATHALLLARLAWCRDQQGHQDDARPLCEQSLALRPYLAVYHNLLRLYRDSGRLRELSHCLDAARRFWAEEQTHWPDEQRHTHSQMLRTVQLDLWLAEDRVEAAEAWLESLQDTLDEEDWCALVAGLAERLATRNRHAQAEDWLRSALRRYPGRLALYTRLADLAELQGRPHQAIALLRRAIALANAQDQPAGSLWLRMAAVALPIHPGLAREAAERARQNLTDASRPSHGGDDTADLTLQIEVALAEVETREQDYPAAERRYRQVLAQRPQLVSALHGLGQLCLQVGRLDEAVALFEQVKAIDATRGYGALITTHRFPDDDATLHQLERLARAPGAGSPASGGLLFQLASAWEKRGDCARAFALADEANAASRSLLRYDPKAHRQYCARIRHAFPGALFEHRADCGHESTLPVFVVGMPRSGTTLVEQIIASHSRIHGAGELGVIPRVIAGLERWERHTGSGRHYPDCVDDLDPTVTRGIAETILQELREYAPEADHVVDKLPHNFLNVGLIRLLFPRAKIISVRRDPRDIAISSYFIDFASKHAGMGFSYDLDWIGEQLADHNLLMHHWHTLWPEGILDVHYEDLVNDPAGSARRMLNYIGVDWEPQVLEFDALQRPVKTASVWQVRQPLYRSSIGRWRKYRQCLAPLIAGTNRKIAWEPIEMVTLPKPGWLNAGVDRYRQGDLDGAESHFKRLLQHLPEHAAAGFMLGLVYVRKGHLRAGIPLLERAHERCPWNRHWRQDLAQAYRLDGRDDDAEALARAPADQPAAPLEPPAGKASVERLDYLFLSGETTCRSPGPAPSGTS